MNNEAYRSEWEMDGCTPDYITWLENRLAKAEDRVLVVEKAIWERAQVASDGSPARQKQIYEYWIGVGEQHKHLDNCQVCLGQKGGVRGNENVVGGILMCDHCTVEAGRKAAA